MRRPSVTTTRHPPSRVPRVRNPADASTTQNGTAKWDRCPEATNDAAISPMTFCASFEPWAKASPADATRSPQRTGASIARLARRSERRARWIPAMAIGKAIAEENTSHRSDPITPSGRIPRSPPQYTAPAPPSASAAPARAPTRQCPELQGRPHHRVARLHTRAPSVAEPSTDTTSTGRSFPVTRPCHRSPRPPAPGFDPTSPSTPRARSARSAGRHLRADGQCDACHPVTGGQDVVPAVPSDAATPVAEAAVGPPAPRIGEPVPIGPCTASAGSCRRLAGSAATTSTALAATTTAPTSRARSMPATYAERAAAAKAAPSPPPAIRATDNAPPIEPRMARLADAGSGWPVDRGGILPWYLAESTEPMTATPMAPPTCRAVLLVAEPTPARSRGNDPITDATDGAMIRPAPRPSSTMPTMAWPNPPEVAVVASRQRPATTMSSPEATTTFVPSQRTRVVDVVAATARTTAMGRMRTPVARGENPRENWRYWVRTKREPIRANTARATAAMATENLRSLKGSRTSIGWAEWCSHATNPARMATARTPAPTTHGDRHPRWGTSMIDQTSRVRPVVDATAPSTSMGRRTGSRESGTSHSAATSPSRTTGTLTRKIDPHQKWASSQPPAIGPMAIPKPVVPDQMPMARSWSSGSRKTSVMMDRVAGMMQAAPRPIAARAQSSAFGDVENAEAADPAPKITSPAQRIFLRPTRSPMLPATNRTPANTQE